MNKHKVEFYLIEYDALRREIELLLSQERQREQYTVLAVAGVWTWLASTPNVPDVFHWAWWIPFGIVVVGVTHNCVITKHFRRLASYLIALEKKLGVTGWESNLRKEEPIRFLSISYHFLVWGLMLIVTLVVPILISVSAQKDAP